MEFSMFKRNYYCLIAGLPELVMEGRRSGAQELCLKFKEELHEQLHTADYKLVEMLYLHYDNRNLLNLLLNKQEAYCKEGNFTQDELEEQIKESTVLPVYMQTIIVEAREGWSQIHIEKLMQQLYYEHVLQNTNDFLSKWFGFEKDMNNVLTAINCRKFNLNIEDQLIQGPTQDDVSTKLQNVAPEATMLADEIPFVDEIIGVAESEMCIADKERALDLIKWKFLDEQSTHHYFTIEKVFGYIIKLALVARWSKLDDESGKVLFTKLVHELKDTYEFPDEFSLNKSLAAQNN